MRLKNLFYEARRVARKHNLEVSTQKDLCYLENTITRYGFDFFPDHYIEEHVNAYVKRVESSCGVRINVSDDQPVQHPKRFKHRRK